MRTRNAWTALVSAAVVAGTAACGTAGRPTAGTPHASSPAASSSTAPSSQPNPVAGASSACTDLSGTLDQDRTCHVHTATPIYTVDFTFPADYADQQGLTAALTKQRDQFVEFVEAPSGRPKPDKPYVLDAKGTAYRSTTPAPGTESLVFEVYTDVGGAHPETEYVALDYDLGKAAPITVGTLFKPGTDVPGVLDPIVQPVLAKRIDGQFDDNLVGAKAHENFAITDDAVIFFIGQGVWLFEAAGPQEVSVPRSQLDAVLAIPAAAKVGPCASGQVSVTASKSSAAATHRATLLTFSLAAGANPCTLTGYPGVDSGAGNSCPTYTDLLVTPPDTTSTAISNRGVECAQPKTERSMMKSCPLPALAAAVGIAAAALTGCSHPAASSMPSGSPAVATTVAATTEPSRAVSYAAQVELPVGNIINHVGGIAADGSGDVYAVDMHYGQVWKFVPGAQPVKLSGGLGQPVHVAVDAAGNLFVSDEFNHAVWELAHGATSPTRLPFNDVEMPGPVAVDAAGDVYVIDSESKRVEVLTTGAMSPTAVPFTGLEKPGGLAVDASGAVYVTDYGNADSAANQVLKLAPGTANSISLPFNGLKQPGGVAVDGDGAVYVTDFADDQVLKLAPGATSPTVLPFAGLDHPGDVAVDDQGNVYVDDELNFRVLKLPVL